MNADHDAGGWGWFESHPEPAEDASDEALAVAFARCFAGPDGEQTFAHLERVFLNRRLGPSASDAELRHLEGQRAVVAHIKALIARGRG